MAIRIRNWNLNKNLIFLAGVLFYPAAVVGECTCDAEDAGDANKSLALRYKVGAIASILIASGVGVLLPVLSKVVPALSPERSFFFVIKAFAAGVILSTGLIHVLPDAFERLTSPCIPEHPWQDFPFAGFTAMVAAIATLMVDTYANSYFSRRAQVKSAAEFGNAVGDLEGPGAQVQAHTHATHGHSPGPLDLDHGNAQLLRHRVISQVLELGIVVHSVIIGIAVGASESPKTIRPLVAALSFHQFFEGIGLGGCIVQAKFKAPAVMVMALLFSLTTPVGIAMGIGITNSYSETSPRSLIIQGLFDSASAGILVYMALVDLLAADFLSPRLQSNGKLQFWCNSSLLIGAGCMSLLAKWA